MNRFLVLFLFFACPFLSDQAYSQPPVPSGPGCPAAYLFNDGSFWAYEANLCTTIFGQNCQPTEMTPFKILFYTKDLGTINPICIFKSFSCECSVTEIPVNNGDAAPLLYNPNGKQPAKFSNKLANATEFVGKTAAGTWYKFVSADYFSRGKTTPIRICFMIKPADNPVACTGSNGPNCTPAAWFIKNDNQTDITVKVVSGTAVNPKKVQVIKNTFPTDYKVIRRQ